MVHTLIDEPQAVLEGRRSAPRELARLGEVGADAILDGFDRFKAASAGDRDVYEAFEYAMTVLASQHPAIVLRLAATERWPPELESARLLASRIGKTSER